MFRRYPLRMTEGGTMRRSISESATSLPVVHAEVRRVGPGVRSCLVRSGPLTPYLLETIADDVRSAGHPSHVEVRVSPDGDRELLASARAAIARLDERAARRRRGGWTGPSRSTR